MSLETKFGRQLLQCTATRGQTLKRRILFLVPAFIAILVGIIIQTDPAVLGDTENLTSMLALFFGIGALFVLLAIFYVKPTKAVLYEGGLAYTRGSKVAEIEFNNVKGISDSTTVVKVYRALDVAKVRQLTIVKNDGAKVVFANAFGAISVPNYNQFADELGTVFTKYLLQNLTKENINQANISFGDQLELAGGQLIYDAGKKEGRISIPLNAVRGCELKDDQGYWLALMGQCDVNGKPEELAEIRADKALNLEALYRIIGMVSAEQQGA